MAGIYIHIPFCKQACNYCDFHFSTSLNQKNNFLNALKNEIRLQKNYLENEKIATVYFGGGTPSLLSVDELSFIFDEIQKHFVVLNDAEITIEANPDDLTSAKIKSFKNSFFNRFSIGIQSFFDADLKFMNRAHSSNEAIASVKGLQDAGFENISIDLIYGIQNLTNENWKKNLQQAFDLEVKHISAYCLTVEPKTALAQAIKKNKIKNVDEHQSADQFEIMLEEMKKNNFVQYEISNFCTENYFSKHNSNYWLKEKYVGFGPSAHSYNGNSRQWNIANNALYLQALLADQLAFEKEELSIEKNYNEYIMTSLRTMWGTDLSYINQKFGNNYSDYCKSESEKYIQSKDLILNENKLFLSDKGKLLADKIASELFSVN
ncbi:MAG TPA: radical SAM family heme chaperone HemW [Bacteroidia bacterium]|nr:radical SAM family heme chaperone HemW [Bacteroidia bacterium]